MSDTRATSVYDAANARMRHIAKTHAFQVWSSTLPAGTDIDTAVNSYTTDAFTVTGTGNLGIGTASPIYPLQVSTSAPVGLNNMIVASYTRSLGTTIGDYTNICTTYSQYGASVVYLDVIHNESGSSETKSYIIPIPWLGANSTYYVCNPIASSGAYSGSQDWQIELQSTSGTSTFRIVRIAGANSPTNYTCVVRVHQSNARPVTVTDSSLTGTVTPSTTVFESTVITQVDGKLGIGTIAPQFVAHVGTVAPGNSDASCLLMVENTAGNVGTADRDAALVIRSKQTGETILTLEQDNGTTRAVSGMYATQNHLVISGPTPKQSGTWNNSTVSIRCKSTGEVSVESGNLGIGISTPIVPLDVSGETHLNVMPTFQTSGILRLGRPDNIRYHDVQVYNDTTAANNFLGFNLHNGTTETSQTRVMTLQGDGNVGIGTELPITLLHVEGSSRLGNSHPAINARINASTVVISTNVGLGTIIGSKTYLQSMASMMGGNAGILQIYENRHTAGNDWNGVSLRLQRRVDTTDQGYIEFNPVGSSSAIAFSGGGSTEDVRILSTGRVGMGTTFPQGRLHCYGAGQTAVDPATTASSASVFLQDSGTGVGNGGMLVFGAGQGNFAAIKGYITNGGTNTTGHLNFATRNAVSDASLTTRMTITAGGSVGIGSTTPVASLNVVGNIKATTSITSDTQFLGQIADTVSTPSFAWSADTTTGMYQPTTSSIAFTTSGSEKVRIQADGNVGIGTATALAKAHIYLTGSGDVLRVDDETAPDTTPFIIKGNGCVGIGMTNPSALLHVSGIMRSTNSIIADNNVGVGTSPIYTVHAYDNSIGGAIMEIANDNAGTGAFSGYEASTSTTDATKYGRLISLGSAFSSASPGFPANGVVLESGTGMTGGLSILTRADAPMRFFTGGSSSANHRMTIDPDGNVGIGTSIPIALTHIYYTGTGDILRVDDSTAPDTTPFIIKDTGSVGIGISNPSHPLHVTGIIRATTDIIANQNVGVGTATPLDRVHSYESVNAGSMIIATNDNAGTSAFSGLAAYNSLSDTNKYVRMIALGNSYTNATNPGYVANGAVIDTGTQMSGGLSIISRHTSGTIRMFTGGSAAANQRMIVDSDGTVGIGTGSPTAFTHIYYTAAGDILRVDDSTAPDTTPFIIKDTGSVGIGISNPGHLLHVAGNINYTGDLYHNGSILPVPFIVAISDEASVLTTGTSKVVIRAPYAMTLTQIPRASVSTASTSGLVTVDIKAGGTTILGANKLSIDANEKTSTTAATATTLATTSIADDTEITFDVTAAGTGTKGLKVTLYFVQT